VKQISLAILGVTLLSSPSLGQIGTFFFPRSGDLDILVSDSNWAIIVADSDQGMLVSPLSEFQFNAAIFDPAASGAFSTPVLRPLTEAPHQLDNGDYAVAIGLGKFSSAVSSSFQLESFLQLRVAGSSATAMTSVAGTPLDVSDPTNRYNQLDNSIASIGGLAALATASGLWTSPAAYIEFNPAKAFVAPLTSAPAGPQDWGQFVFPEPGTAALIGVAVTILAARRNRAG
jgi:hypothetical protein